MQNYLRVFLFEKTEDVVIQLVLNFFIIVKRYYKVIETIELED